MHIIYTRMANNNKNVILNKKNIFQVSILWLCSRYYYFASYHITIFIWWYERSRRGIGFFWWVRWHYQLLLSDDWRIDIEAAWRICSRAIFIRIASASSSLNILWWISFHCAVIPLTTLLKQDEIPFSHICNLRYYYIARRKSTTSSLSSWIWSWKLAGDKVAGGPHTHSVNSVVIIFISWAPLRQ